MSIDRQAKRERIKQWKSDLRELRDLAFKWDVLRVEDSRVFVPDEYDCLIHPLFRFLRGEPRREDVVRFLAEFSFDHFGFLTERQKDEQFADALMEWARCSANLSGDAEMR